MARASLPDLRHRLFQLAEELVRGVRTLDTAHAHLRVSLYRQRIRCGHPGCHCASGPGHLRWCVGFASPTARHTRSLSAVEFRRIEPAARAYQRYRKARAHVARLAREMLALVDRIGRALEKPLTRSLD